MVALECNVHGWMHAWLAVLPHPSSGWARDAALRSRSAAGTYTIEAWHEKYGAQTASVTVGGQRTKTADFSFAASD